MTMGFDLNVHGFIVKQVIPNILQNRLELLLLFEYEPYELVFVWEIKVL